MPRCATDANEVLPVLLSSCSYSVGQHGLWLLYLPPTVWDDRRHHCRGCGRRPSLHECRAGSKTALRSRRRQFCRLSRVGAGGDHDVSIINGTGNGNGNGNRNDNVNGNSTGKATVTIIGLVTVTTTVTVAVTGMATVAVPGMATITVTCIGIGNSNGNSNG